MATAQAKRSTDRYTYPVGGGGIPGRIARMLIMVVTFGFVYPNAFVEGMSAADLDSNYTAKSDVAK